MIYGYKVGATDPLITFPIARDFGGVNFARVEKDLSFLTDGGQRSVYKQSSKRRWDLPFTLIGTDQYGFFEQLHKTVNGRAIPFYFTENVSISPADFFYVRKEKDFRPVLQDSPAIENGIVKPVWNYRLKLLEEQATVHLGTNRFRPRQFEEYDSEAGAADVNPTRSRVLDGDLALDADPSHSTFAQLEINSTRPTALNYSSLLLYDFPQPTGPITSATITIWSQYIPPSSGTDGPISDITVFDGRNVGANDLTNGHGTLWGGGGMTPAPKAMYQISYTPTDWTNYFGGDASRIWVRATQWHSFFFDFPDAAKIRWFDCYIDYTY